MTTTKTCQPLKPAVHSRKQRTQLRRATSKPASVTQSAEMGKRRSITSTLQLRVAAMLYSYTHRNGEILSARSFKTADELTLLTRRCGFVPAAPPGIRTKQCLQLVAQKIMIRSCEVVEIWQSFVLRARRNRKRREKMSEE